MLRAGAWLLAIILFLPPGAASSAALGGPFTLTDHTGHPYSLARARGKTVLLFFGYTSCPDVCPTTLSHVASVMRALGRSASQVQPLFVSLDPRRDTKAVLSRYVQHFHPSIIALTGSSEDLARVAEAYGAPYRFSGEQLEHSADLYVIDVHGKLRALLPFGTRSADVVNYLQTLMKEG